MFSGVCSWLHVRMLFSTQILTGTGTNRNRFKFIHTDNSCISLIVSVVKLLDVSF